MKSSNLKSDNMPRFIRTNQDAYEVLGHSEFLKGVKPHFRIFEWNNFSVISDKALKNVAYRDYLNKKVVKYLLDNNVHAELPIHEFYPTKSNEYYYYKINKSFFKEVESILIRRNCEDVTNEVCMTLRTIAFHFFPHYDSSQERIRKIDKAKERKEFKIIYPDYKEEIEFNNFMKNTIKLLASGRPSATFDKIIFKTKNKPIEFKSAWLKNKIVELYNNNMFNSQNNLNSLPSENENNITLINKKYKYNPAKRLYILFRYFMCSGLEKTAHKEAVKMIGELYAAIGIFTKINANEIESEILKEKKEILYKFRTNYPESSIRRNEKAILEKLQWNESAVRQKHVNSANAQLHEKERRKNIIKWIELKNKKEYLDYTMKSNYKIISELFS
jgi:hypothetical protein